MGALGAALGAMVANLSSHKAGWDDRWEEFSDYAEQGQALMERLLYLVDEDTESFNRIMAVFAMPKGTEAEKAARDEAMESATLYATQVPLRTAETSYEAFALLKAMAENGNPASASDVAWVLWQLARQFVAHFSMLKSMRHRLKTAKRLISLPRAERSWLQWRPRLNRRYWLLLKTR